MTYEESKPGQLDPEHVAREKFDAALLERLKTLAPTFLDIRAKMGVGSNVGFGSLPDMHGVYTLGTIPLLKINPEDGSLLYPIPDGFGSSIYKPLTSKENLRLIITPQITAASRVVSIYQKTGYQEDRQFEERLLTAPIEVYEGVIAHELAHMFNFGVPKPPLVEEVLQRREQEYKEFSSKNGIKELNRAFDLTGEARMDIAAGLFGYKKQILAKLDYIRSCLRTYKDANETGFSHFKTSGNGIQELNVREKEVLRYCP